MSKPFSGVKDVDLKIMSELDDRDLFSLCKSEGGGMNKYIHGLCKDENFWRNRLTSKYGDMAAQYKLESSSWRQYYLQITVDLGKYSDDPWSFFSINIPWNIHNPYFQEITDELSPSNQTSFWLLNLGDIITIGYILDPDEDLPLTRKTYVKQKGYFTPAEVLQLIYDFYQEKITIEELEEQQAEETVFANDFSPEDIGTIQRIDLLGDYVYFEGFLRSHDGAHLVNLGD